MRIAFVHYLIGDKSGISAVMRTNILSLRKLYPKVSVLLAGKIVSRLMEDPQVKYVDIKELDIGKGRQLRFERQDVYTYMHDGEKIFEKVKNAVNGCDYVIIENPSLGLHPAATYAFYRLAQHNAESKGKSKIVFRIHDFAEDRPGKFANLLKFSGKDTPLWHFILYPNFRNLGYFVINRQDKTKLYGHGLIEKGKVFYIPNPVDESLLQGNNEQAKKLKELIIKKKRLDKHVKFIFYPVRAIARKNIEEAIFLIQLLNYHLNEKYHLLVNVRESDNDSLQYSRKIEKFSRKYRLPVIIGLQEFVAFDRVMENGQIKKYGIGDAYNMADKVITTSMLEGFGMAFIEPWYHGKAVFGRDLPLVTSDFKRRGVNLEHLYSTLFIGKKDFKDLGSMDAKLRLSLRLKNKQFRKEIWETNYHQLRGMLEVFDKEFEEELVRENRAQVVANYNQYRNARDIIRALKGVR
ncbi:hypothetical protein J4475_00680 [Candidatus Woesearchaeota archaeon]|nr:hypothetical protein [Candidatus Woesearchaeota archaeon]